MGNNFITLFSIMALMGCQPTQSESTTASSTESPVPAKEDTEASS